MPEPTFNDLRHAAEEHEEDVEPADKRLLLGSALMTLGEGEFAKLHVGRVSAFLRSLVTSITLGAGHKLAQMRRRVVEGRQRECVTRELCRGKDVGRQLSHSPYRLNPVNLHLETLGPTN